MKKKSFLVRGVAALAILGLLVAVVAPLMVLGSQ